MIKWFKDLNIKDIALAGGKNAALGELISAGIPVPNGFAITAEAFNYVLESNHLKKKIKKILKKLDTHNLKDLKIRGKKIRDLILNAELPKNLQDEIAENYNRLGSRIAVAVRSSATAEDLPSASFAGQQETYLNVIGVNNVLSATKRCMASLFTDRAISYRADKGFGRDKISLSVGIQKMVKSASSGIAFTIDPETGLNNVIVINSIKGLGEAIVQGKIIPDEFVVFKPTMKIISRDIIHNSLTDKEVLVLAKLCLNIDEYFNKPMDIEWAKDSRDGKIYIVQARPETVHSQKRNVYKKYDLQGKGRPILYGAAVGTKIASGKVRIIKNSKNINLFKPGEVLATEITDPDWEPIMKIASAIITDKGGRTSHAAIVSRELGIPCIVGTGQATKIFRTGEKVTVDCSSGTKGIIHQGEIAFKITKRKIRKIPKTKTKITLNIGSPDEAWNNHYLPIQGVGLGRLEFIISSYIRIHPNALINYHKLDKALKNKINKLTFDYKDKKQFYIDELAEGIAKIAATVWPYETIIRFSDFKTNEYRTLLGGGLYEPEEENPMLGWRGASRYYDERFREAFILECLAIKKVNQEMGFKSISLMVPFCRTPEEGEKVVKIIRKYIKNSKIYVMAEIPSNIILADEFLKIFDGMSIGSNDLTQLILGIDRDNGDLAKIANENNPAVKKIIKELIIISKKKNKYIGICGQAPSDYPSFARWLSEQGIDAISLNPDSVLETIKAIR